MVVFDTAGDNLFSSSPLISLIMYSRERPEIFNESISSMARTCSDPSKVEIVCKFDYDDVLNIPLYLDVVRNIHGEYGIHTKVVISDRLDGYWSIHTYLNDLTIVARGKILWVLGDDIIVRSGDWVSLLESTRTAFADCIYVVHIPGAERKNKMISPALSREWIDALGMVSPHPAADRFLALLGSRIGRLICDPHIMNGLQIEHNRGQIPRLPINIPPHAIKANIDSHVDRLAPVINKHLKG